MEPLLSQFDDRGGEKCGGTAAHGPVGLLPDLVRMG